MADVDPRREHVGDRGQLILVTALAIAVAMVAMVLLLNTVIYAENLATRGADVGGQDAIEYRGTVVRGVGGTIDAENRQDYESHDAARENVSAAIDRIDFMLARHHLRRGELVEISNVTTTDGTIVRHPTDTDNFSSAGGASNWLLTGPVPGVRGFVMTVDRDDVSAVGIPGSFRVILSDGTNTWAAYVYDDGTAVTIETKNATEGSPSPACTATGANVTIDFTRGLVDGEPCPGLDFARGLVGSYSVTFDNAEAAGGTYEMTLQVSPSDAAFPNGNYNSPGGDAPYYAYAVYDATLDVRFRADGLRFTDEIRIAPGEPT